MRKETFSLIRKGHLWFLAIRSGGSLFFATIALSGVIGDEERSMSAIPEASLPISGVEPIFRHLNDADVPWQKVRRQQNSDGTEGTVYEKWFAFSPDPQYLSLLAKYSPGMVVRRHGHFSPHIVYIMEGGATFGDRWCPAGTHIELPFGAAFGPIVAGTDGATMFEVMLGDPRSWGDQSELFDTALSAQGAVALPDEPLEFPPWLEDLRSHWNN